MANRLPYPLRRQEAETSLLSLNLGRAPVVLLRETVPLALPAKKGLV